MDNDETKQEEIDGQLFPSIVNTMVQLNRTNEALATPEVWHYVKSIMDGLKMTYQVQDYGHSLPGYLYIKLEG